MTSRRRHTRSLDIKRSKRPGPVKSAAEQSLGKRMRGNNGQMYTVKMDKRGIKRWVKDRKTRR